MEHDAGIDVSLERSSVCIVGGTGKIAAEARLASEPEALIGWLRARAVADGPGGGSQWLFAGLEADGLVAAKHAACALPSRPCR
jgi:transposase